jgi:hypothetical protein
MRRHATTLILFTAVVAALAALAALLLPSSAAATAPAQQVTVVPAMHATTPQPDAFLVALVGEGTDLPVQQAEALSLAADRVCEGITAQVPEGFMIRTVSEEEGLTLEEAHRFVETATAVHCAA